MFFDVLFINIAFGMNYHFLKLKARCCWKYYHNSSKLGKSHTCCDWRCCRNNLHLKVVVGICECCLMRITHGILMFLVCCIDYTPPRHNLWEFDTKLYFVLEGGRAASFQMIKKWITKVFQNTIFCASIKITEMKRQKPFTITFISLLSNIKKNIYKNKSKNIDFFVIIAELYIEILFKHINCYTNKIFTYLFRN